MSLAIFNSLARLLWALICSVESLFGVNGALSLEWYVLPSSSRLAAIPVVAVASATHPLGSKLLTADKIAFRRNVFPQPPLASIEGI